jgi:hypothetical protein
MRPLPGRDLEETVPGPGPNCDRCESLAPAAPGRPVTGSEAAPAPGERALERGWGGPGRALARRRGRAGSRSAGFLRGHSYDVATLLAPARLLVSPACPRLCAP